MIADPERGLPRVAQLNQGMASLNIGKAGEGKWERLLETPGQANGEMEAKAGLAWMTG